MSEERLEYNIERALEYIEDILKFKEFDLDDIKVIKSILEEE